MSEWIVSWNSHTCPEDDGFFDWWEVTDGKTKFTAESEPEAEWLCNLLNSCQRPELEK